MLSGTDFVKKIKEGNSELFEASRSNVRRFFASKPSDEYLDNIYLKSYPDLEQ